MALTHYYVDPGGGSDVTGDGSIGTPWASVQHALDTITRDTTNGDQINLKAGTPDVLEASLSLATYGTPTYLAPLVIRGYASMANDGGMGAITAGDAFTCTDNTFAYTMLADLQIVGYAGYYAVRSTGIQVSMFRCMVTGAGSGVLLSGAGTTVAGCTVATDAAPAIIATGAVLYNYVSEPTPNAWGSPAIRIDGTGASCCAGNIIVLQNKTATEAEGIRLYRGHTPVVLQNSIINLLAGRGTGIAMRSIYQADLRMAIVINNIVQGFSGGGGVGIATTSGNLNVAGTVAHNALYNCTTNYSWNHIAPLLAFDNITLDADPFVDAANGDFRLTDAAQAVLRSAGWPTGYLGMDAAIDPHITIGALQYGPGAIRRVARILGG